jgi:hypothetical protein
VLGPIDARPFKSTMVTLSDSRIEISRGIAVPASIPRYARQMKLRAFGGRGGQAHHGGQAFTLRLRALGEHPTGSGFIRTPARVTLGPGRKSIKCEMGRISK